MPFQTFDFHYSVEHPLFMGGGGGGGPQNNDSQMFVHINTLIIKFN